MGDIGEEIIYKYQVQKVHRSTLDIQMLFWSAVWSANAVHRGRGRERKQELCETMDLITIYNNFTWEYWTSSRQEEGTRSTELERTCGGVLCPVARKGHDDDDDDTEEAHHASIVYFVKAWENRAWKS